MKLFQILLSLVSDIEGSSFPPGTFMGQYWSKLIYYEATGRSDGDKGLDIYDESITYGGWKMIATFELKNKGL